MMTEHSQDNTLLKETWRQELRPVFFKQLFTLPLIRMEEQPLWYWQSLFQDANLVRNVLGGATAVLVIDLPFALLFILLTSVVSRVNRGG